MNNHLLKVLRQRMQGIPKTPREINYSLQMLSEMRSLGWHRSLRKVQPLDRDGSPMPWYTYTALEWLMPRVKQTDVVFEFGAGNSTVWYGRHAKEVVAVEHDTKWLEHVQRLVGSNVTLLSRSMSGSELSPESESPYCVALYEYPPKYFDIIVIDGEERVQCAHVAPSRLRDDGIIVFDNSDRPVFGPGLDYLHHQGFGRIDFYGFCADVGTYSCTSLFSKFETRWTTENVPVASPVG